MVPPMSADTIVVLDAMGVLYQPATTSQTC